MLSEFFGLVLAGMAAAETGAVLYGTHCADCHQVDGGGVPFLQPELIGSSRANGPKNGMIEIILEGSDAVPPGTSDYGNLMPGFSALSDTEIAAIATYVRASFSNKGSAITAEDVRAVRGRTEESSH